MEMIKLIACKLKSNRDGAIAVEYALVMPLFLFSLFGLIAFSSVFTIMGGLQQLATESARAAIAGLSTSERATIAQTFIGANVGKYAFVDPTKLTVATQAQDGPPATFQVSLTYDLASQTAKGFGTFIPFLPGLIRRSAVVTVGTSL